MYTQEEEGDKTWVDTSRADSHGEMGKLMVENKKAKETKDAKGSN